MVANFQLTNDIHLEKKKTAGQTREQSDFELTSWTYLVWVAYGYLRENTKSEMGIQVFNEGIVWIKIDIWEL